MPPAPAREKQEPVKRIATEVPYAFHLAVASAETREERYGRSQDPDGGEQAPLQRLPPECNFQHEGSEAQRSHSSLLTRRMTAGAFAVVHLPLTAGVRAVSVLLHFVAFAVTRVVFALHTLLHGLDGQITFRARARPLRS